MAGVEIYLDWDDADLQAMLQGLARNVRDASPVMDDFSEYMMSETMERFEKEEDPEGHGWQTLKPVTEAQRAKAGKWPGKILQVDGILKNSIQRIWDGSSSGLTTGLAGSGLEYAAIHNEGGKAGRNRNTDIPRRQYLGFSDDDIAYFKRSLAGWLVTGRVI